MGGGVAEVARGGQIAIVTDQIVFDRISSQVRECKIDVLPAGGEPVGVLRFGIDSEQFLEVDLDREEVDQIPYAVNCLVLVIVDFGLVA